MVIYVGLRRSNRLGIVAIQIVESNSMFQKGAHTPKMSREREGMALYEDQSVFRCGACDAASLSAIITVCLDVWFD